MVAKKKVKVGEREFEISALSVDNRLEIDDLLSAHYFKLGVDMTNVKSIMKAPPSMQIAWKAVKMSVEKVPDDLENIEILELFAEIQNLSHLSETDKKK